MQASVPWSRCRCGRLSGCLGHEGKEGIGLARRGPLLGFLHRGTGRSWKCSEEGGTLQGKIWTDEWRSRTHALAKLCLLLVGFRHQVLNEGNQLLLRTFRLLLHHLKLLRGSVENGIRHSWHVGAVLNYNRVLTRSSRRNLSAFNFSLA